MDIIDIMERPSSRDALRDWYSAILEDQESSGLSVAEYADKVGLSAATLYQWRRRLHSVDSGPSADDSQSLIECKRVS